MVVLHKKDSNLLLLRLKHWNYKYIKLYLFRMMSDCKQVDEFGMVRAFTILTVVGIYFWSLETWNGLISDK